TSSSVTALMTAVRPVSTGNLTPHPKTAKSAPPSAHVSTIGRRSGESTGARQARHPLSTAAAVADAPRHRTREKRDGPLDAHHDDGHLASDGARNRTGALTASRAPA